ncbi:universal stress protein [Enterovibrio sp. ZSDZ35]|uniref:Universal stress protein n=1 Tax=Enterovibrio qingdaonensis TaxID=2899818 RepID=A0ABT5QU56_9GAMM|nr:universal stress protein [Enterovibrio sp. ZSDZ35]MDD1784124.1 universal stress protein [Enterovibrio sp. ZSDZ35]
MYSKILYALDIDSKANLDKAIKIAEQLNAELFIGYATYLGESYQDDEVYFGKHTGDEIVDEDKKDLERKIESLFTETTISKDHIYIIDGPVGKAIDKLATSLSVELVIVAKSHHHFSLMMKNDTLIRLTTHYDFLSFN